MCWPAWNHRRPAEGYGADRVEPERLELGLEMTRPLPPACADGRHGLWRNSPRAVCRLKENAMCLAVPSRVIALDLRHVDRRGIRQTLRSACCSCPRSIARRLPAIQAGGFAFARVEADRAEDSSPRHRRPDGCRQRRRARLVAAFFWLPVDKAPARPEMSSGGNRGSMPIHRVSRRTDGA